MFWDSGYQRASPPGWQRPGINPAFTFWFGTPITGKNVLIPGCGTAEEPLQFTRMGNAVTMVEIAPTALEIQKKKYAAQGLPTTAVEFDLSDLLNSWTPPRAFDVVYEQTCLCAINPGDRGKYESKIYSCLRPGGDLFILFMQKKNPQSADGPPFHCDLADMKELFAVDRWQWQSTAPEVTSPHHMGVTELGFHLVKR